jgi:membrane-associated protein
MEEFKALLAKYRDLHALVSAVGVWGLHAIVFAETGLLVGFFLPGDSLLFTAGVLASTGVLKVGIWPLLAGLSVAAVAGDQVGYLIGKKAGQALYAREDSRFFKRKHLLAAHDFYEKYGGKTIFLARFVPIIRTFAPTVAGAAGMEYRRFVLYNVVGGVSWVWAMVGGGYLLVRRFPWLEKHIEVVALLIVLISVVPIVLETVKARREKAAAAAAVGGDRRA